MKKYLLYIRAFFVPFVFVLLIGIVAYFWLAFTPGHMEGPQINAIPKDLTVQISPLLEDATNGTQIETIGAIGLDDRDGEPATTKKLENNNFQIILRSPYFYNNNEFNSLFAKKVLSHELMHVFSQQDNQIVFKATGGDKAHFDAEEAKCKPNFYSFNGCFKTDSYVTKFYQQFWTGDLVSDYDKIQSNSSNKDEFQNDMAAWKDKYKENFVSDTATIDPEEDLAESFSIFVMGDTQGLNEKQIVKIKFFEQFEELKLLKKKINQKI